MVAQRERERERGNNPSSYANKSRWERGAHVRGLFYYGRSVSNPITFKLSNFLN